jgi:hypothetical protein
MPFYPGAGKAALLRANRQGALFTNDRPGPGTPNKASVAFELERVKSASYPFGFAMEFAFSGAPGGFEIDVQGAENDQDANYCQLGTAITTVNANNVCRFEGVNLYPSFVRAFVKTLGNDVQVTGVVTR